MNPLRLSDDESALDLSTYLARAKHLDETGDVRLQAVGGVLAAWTCVMPGQGVGSAGLVLGLRTFALAEPVHQDQTVPIGAVTDRLAHSGREIAEIPMSTSPTWRALSPPRSGWESVGSVPGHRMRTAAMDGIAEVAQGAPEGSGSAAVADLRHRVWGRLTQTVPPIPAGAAFGMHVLGFLAPDEGGSAAVHAQGPWTRVSTQRGFVVTR